MKVVIIYRPNSEHGSMVENFARDYQRQHQGKLELLNVDGQEGGALASLYDLMQYPAIVALREDGSVLNIWQGETLPLMDEVAAYANA
jgi:hypothetical protein